MAQHNPVSRETEKIYKAQFGTYDYMVRSPGRINLIGEHTDYNMGFVLPAAIDKAIYMAIGKRSDTEIHLYAGDLGESYIANVNDVQRTDRQWPDYILGVVDELKKAGYQIGGFNAVMMGDVPLGAGLSSSAAVECVTAFALNTLFDLGIDKTTMVQISQRAENEFVGTKCGIMDQFASMFGQKEKVIQLDCRSLGYAYMPFETKEISLVLFDTGVKHSLASSEYNVRRAECEEGVRIIQQRYPQVKSLRDATIDMVEECLGDAPAKVYKRCRFMVEEIQRVPAACNDLVQHNLAAFGEKMYATHDGLSKMYEVSCTEADALVEMVRNHNGVIGARMMGGGFGGCTLNIVEKGSEEALIAEVTQKFGAQFQRELKTYVVTIDDGTSLVS